MSALPSGPTQLLDLRNLRELRKARTPINPLAFDSGNPTTRELPKNYPIDGLRCRLTGGYTVTTNPATANPNLAGAMNLIRGLSIIADGKDNYFSLPGRLIQKWSNLHANTPQSITAETYTAGASLFEYAFDIPFNKLDGQIAMLDPSVRNDLVLRVDWGTITDLATPGAGGHSFHVTPQLHVDVWGQAGGPPGQFGGPGAKYVAPLVDHRTYPITLAQPDFPIKLQKGHLYQRFILDCRTTNGVPSNAILNKVTVRIGQTTLHVATGAQLQAENRARYGFPALQTGFYVLDLCDETAERRPFMTDLVGVFGSLDFEMILDVNKPGTDTVTVIAEHYARDSEFAVVV